MRSRSFFPNLLAALGAVGLISGLLALSPLLSNTAAAADDPVTKGRSLAVLCMECHTPHSAGDPYKLETSKLLAGGQEFAGPWGLVYSRNITPDRGTGIGAWTDDEIKRAITQGIARDGTKLVLMPYEVFRGMADEDVNAIVAYLRTVPAINNAIAPPRLAPPQAIAGFVGSIPPLAAVVPPALYSSPRDVFHDFVQPGSDYAVPPARAGFIPPGGTDNPARGEYLVKTVYGCAACHSGNLAGGAPPFFAPNISPDRETGIGSWSKEDIVRAVREGVRPSGARIAPIMPVGELGFGYINNDDLYNVIAYLRSVPPVRRAAGQPNPLFAPPPGAPAALPRTGDTHGEYGAWLLLAGAAALTSGVALRRRLAPVRVQK